MFVLNCRVSDTVRLSAQWSNASEAFLPVLCATCDTEVGVRDSEEVYHFAGVLATHA
jgi:hypothetical protein